MTSTEIGKRTLRAYNAHMPAAATRSRHFGRQSAFTLALLAASACGDGESVVLIPSVDSNQPDAGAGAGGGEGGTRPVTGGRPGRPGAPSSGGTAGTSVGGEGGAFETAGAAGSAGEGAASGTPNTPPKQRCIGDADCDDGLFCNGVELCLLISKTVSVCKAPAQGPCGHRACDEITDECDCSNPDEDGDLVPVEGCTTGDEVDCDDQDKFRSPRHGETCAGDPTYDEDCDDDTFRGAGDGDGDGDGSYDEACKNYHFYQAFDATPETREFTGGDDCDDGDAERDPQLKEICDNKDNDCHGGIDDILGASDGEVSTYYFDGDGDFHGDPAQVLKTLCRTPPDQYVADQDGDCDDTKKNISPDMPEVCNGFDDDCDGSIDQPPNGGDFLFDYPGDVGRTEFECTGKAGWKVKTCPPLQLDCGEQDYRDGCETNATTLCNCHACGNRCSFSCGENECEEVRAVSAGGLFTCAIVAPPASSPVSGSVACWGANSSGQLGNGETKASSIAVKVQDLTGATQIAAGLSHSCAIADGELTCWGRNDLGQLGYNGAELHVPFPVPVEAPPFADSPVQVAVGAYHSCAIYDEGRVACWGDGEAGQLGTGADAAGFRSTRPMHVVRTVSGTNQLIDDAKQVSAGFKHTCAITALGIECWGDNEIGQLGISPDELASSSVAQPVPGLPSSEFDQVAAGAFHTCARSNSQIYCWGSNLERELSVEDADFGAAVLIEVPAAATVVTGQGFSCALTREGAVYCWGSNYYGERGELDVAPALSPTRVPIEVASGLFGGTGFHVCATTPNGVSCWGRNDLGQLGRGNTMPQTRPGALLPLSGSRACAP